MIEATVGEVMTLFPECIDVRETFLKVRDLMMEHDVRHLPVTREGKVVGIVSDRDLAVAHEFFGKVPDMTEVEVGDFCTEDVVTFDRSAPLSLVLQEMADARIGSIIVVDEGGPAGIFTSTDACRIFSDWIKSQK